MADETRYRFISGAWTAAGSVPGFGVKRERHAARWQRSQGLPAQAWSLVEHLVAELETAVTDGVRRWAASHNSFRSTETPTAEVAARALFVFWDEVEPCGIISRGRCFVRHARGRADAALTDPDARPTDELAGIELGSPAKRAESRRAGSGLPSSPGQPGNPAAAAAFLDELVHALMAEFQRVSDLPQGASRRMQATNGPAEVGLLLSQLELELAAALPYGQRLLDQLLVEWHQRSLPSKDTRRNPYSMARPAEASEGNGAHQIALQWRRCTIVATGQSTMSASHDQPPDTDSVRWSSTAS